MVRSRRSHLSSFFFYSSYFFAALSARARPIFRTQAYYFCCLEALGLTLGFHSYMLSLYSIKSSSLIFLYRGDRYKSSAIHIKVSLSSRGTWYKKDVLHIILFLHCAWFLVFWISSAYFVFSGFWSCTKILCKTFSPQIQFCLLLSNLALFFFSESNKPVCVCNSVLHAGACMLPAFRWFRTRSQVELCGSTDFATPRHIAIHAFLSSLMDNCKFVPRMG